MNSDNQQFRGYSAIITGGAGLLGREHAIALAEIGYKVFLFDVDFVSLIAAKVYIESTVPGSSIQTVICDITSEKDISKAIKNINDDSNQLRCLINNAAMNPNPKDKKLSYSIENFDLLTWNEEIAVGLTGAILMCKHVGPILIAGGGGYILNISSDLSVISPDQRIYVDDETERFIKPVSYSIIKTGLIGLTRYLATYWAKDNIRVNAISPGGIENNQSEQFIRNLENLIPLARMATKSEYRGAIKFLCSDQSTYMTGQNLIIDGGRSVW